MLKPYVRAAFPAVAVATVEEDRFIQHLLNDFPDKSIFTVSATGGLKDLRTGAVVDSAVQESDETTKETSCETQPKNTPQPKLRA
jgi:hypothetical protein